MSKNKKEKPILKGEFIKVGNLKGYHLYKKRDIPEGTILGYGGIYPIVHRKLTAQL